MSKIEVWVNGFSSAKENRSSFAVSLSCGNDRLDRCYAFTEIAHPINLVSLYGLEFALKAINGTNATIVLHLTNRYAIDMLEKDNDGWLKAASANKDVVTSIRDLIMKFSSFSVVNDKSDARMTEVRNKARCISNED